MCIDYSYTAYFSRKRWGKIAHKGPLPTSYRPGFPAVDIERGVSSKQCDSFLYHKLPGETLAARCARAVTTITCTTLRRIQSCHNPSIAERSEGVVHIIIISMIMTMIIIMARVARKSRSKRARVARASADNNNNNNNSPSRSTPVQTRTRKN